MTNSSSSSFIVAYTIEMSNGERLGVTSVSGDYEPGITLPTLDLLSLKKAGSIQGIVDLIRAAVNTGLECTDDEDPDDEEEMDDEEWTEDEDDGLEFYKEELLGNVGDILQHIENGAQKIEDIKSISVINIQEATGEMMDGILDDLDNHGVSYQDPDVLAHNLAAVKEKLRASEWGRNMRERHIDAAAKMLVDDTNPQIIVCGTKDTYDVANGTIGRSAMFTTEEYVMQDENVDRFFEE